MNRFCPFIFSMIFFSFCFAPFLHAEEGEPKVSLLILKDRLLTQVDGKEIAQYVFIDEEIPRPYFAHVKTQSGIQATRNHPPVEGNDRTDHATMHPGIWMAFGDLDGADFWRNKGRVQHQSFSNIKTEPGQVSFEELKHYLRANGEPICKERFRCTFRVLESGYLIEWDSTFSSDREFYFGDQEEMGLGMRMTTPVSEIEGGLLSDSHKRQGAKAIWSESADWCDYSGKVDGKTVGMTILCHPENFRKSWMHARNYGFVAANPFGRKAMHKGETSKVIVKPGESLRLRYGVFIHSGPVDLDRVYKEYVQQSK